MTGASRDVLELLRASGAMKSGHFLLASGRHSDQYIEKFDLLRRPAVAVGVCSQIADRFRGNAIDVVAGPTTGGVILAFEIARQLGTEAAYAERRSDGQPGREFRRGTTFALGSRVLVVDDILTTGGSVRETLAALNQYSVVVAGIALLVDRTSGEFDLGMPYVALARVDIATWEPAECPLCARGVELVKPGTTPGT